MRAIGRGESRDRRIRGRAILGPAPLPAPDSSVLRAATLLLSLAVISLPAPVEAQQLSPAEIERGVESARPDAFALYRELLALPNVASDAEAIDLLVGWLEGAFDERGFDTERLPTGGRPLLFAERRIPDADRTVLVYLQADGQPVDPSAWDQESPWVPVLKERTPEGAWRPIPWERREVERPDPDWRIFARSASDSKGPIAQFLTALSVAEDTGVRPDFDLKVIVDTEEETGSPHLPAAVERFGNRLAADMLVIFDGPPHTSGRPTLKFGARGIALATLTTYGPRSPQHSGHYGNWIPNPAFQLSELLASLKDDAGRVRIPGWYDGISLDEETRRILEAVPDDEAGLRRQFGLAATDSVAGSLQEAVQYPSLNVRGMRAGWVGEEARTIVPATAVAEIDVRLVVESDPDRLIGLLREHVRDRGYRVLDRPPTEEERLEHPRIATLESTVLYGAFRTPFESEPGRWLARALVHLRGEEPVRIRTSGGSIPISPFVRTLGVPAVSVPTVNPDNNQHSPNENLLVGHFLDGIETMLAVLAEPVTP
ncbi:MAG: M20/M25/M40 family metallo-hydrolase [Gemmatimonadota bacterium]